LTGSSSLNGAKDRVETLGGRIWLRSPPGSGTTVEIELPL
jgi:signal transduction histidine kinase